jgi:hypothetical protein
MLCITANLTRHCVEPGQCPQKVEGPLGCPDGPQSLRQFHILRAISDLSAPPLHRLCTGGLCPGRARASRIIVPRTAVKLDGRPIHARMGTEETLCSCPTWGHLSRCAGSKLRALYSEAARLILLPPIFALAPLSLVSAVPPSWEPRAASVWRSGPVPARRSFNAVKFRID